MGLMGTLVKVAIGYAAARGVDKLAAGQAMGGGAQIKGESPTSEMQAQMAQMMGGQMPEGGNPMQAMMDKMKDSGMDLSSLMGGMAGGAGGNPMAAMMEQMSKAGFDMSALMGGAKPEAGDQGGLLSSASGGGAG
ncbi:MAG: DUF533 domain-containing protein, partial [Paracoccaceae bacterium]|nr:DUF533 domain-containing protein [Paracoccaceae bacterium]